MSGHPKYFKTSKGFSGGIHLHVLLGYILTKSEGSLVQPGREASIWFGNTIQVWCPQNYSHGKKKISYTWQFFVTFSGWLSDPFEWLSDLQLGDEKVTKNHLVTCVCLIVVTFLRILPMGCITIIHHHLGEYVFTCSKNSSPANPSNEVA